MTVETVRHCQRLVYTVPYNLRVEISIFQERNGEIMQKKQGKSNTDYGNGWEKLRKMYQYDHLEIALFSFFEKYYEKLL